MISRSALPPTEAGTSFILLAAAGPFGDLVSAYRKKAAGARIYMDISYACTGSSWLGFLVSHLDDIHVLC